MWEYGNRQKERERKQKRDGKNGIGGSMERDLVRDCTKTDEVDQTNEMRPAH